MGHSQRVSEREIHSNIGLPQEIRKISNKQPNITPKGTRKRRTNKAQRVEGRNKKDKRGINIIESKNTINEIKS